jgi:hypothetical protein
VEPDRFEHVDRLLAERGHALGPRVRVAAGKSGIAVGFPDDPVVHVSWWVLGALALVSAGRALQRRRRLGDERVGR